MFLCYFLETETFNNLIYNLKITEFLLIEGYIIAYST